MARVNDVDFHDILQFMLPRFVVVIPSYNNSNWYLKNLTSVLSQKYDNYRVIYTDDCSPDGTGDLVRRFIDENKISNIKLNQNSTRKGAMENMYNMVHSCEDDEIIVVLDGDDWFAHDGVLSRLSVEYANPDIWVTYGQFTEHPGGGIGCSRQIPENIKASGSYRRFRWCSSHLRTYYAWLFKKINVQDFKVNGNFLPMASDLAVMFPMLEMAGSRHSFIPDILYIYNCENSLNDSKVDIRKQQSLEFYIRGKAPYKRI